MLDMLDVLYKLVPLDVVLATVSLLVVLTPNMECALALWIPLT